MQQFGFGAEKVKSISNRVRDAQLNFNASITTDDTERLNCFFLIGFQFAPNDCDMVRSHLLRGKYC